MKNKLLSGSYPETEGFRTTLFIIILFFTIFSYNSCDILRNTPFEVIAWTPEGGYHSEPEKIAITLDFSLEPDRASAERHFSLTADGSRVKGTFSWNDKKMIFVPLSPLEKNTDYILNLSADVHDIKGLSMDDAFIHNFTTRPDNTRPVLLSCYPPADTEVNDPRTEIRLSFSIPVPLKTLYDNVAFSPSMTGIWRLEEEGKLAVFTPAEPWIQHSRYEIRFSSLLTDNNGMNAGKDFLSVFTTGTDHEAPYLLHARRITKDGDVFHLTADMGYIGAAQLPAENHGWEKDDRLSLVFSEPVDGLSVKTNLITDDAPGFVMEIPSAETDNGYNTEFIFRFDSVPVYESRFTIRLKPGVKDTAGNESKDEYIYRIFTNGKYSKPPVLAGLRIPMSPEGEAEPELVFAAADSLFTGISALDSNFLSGESRQIWIEFYFAVAEGASVEPFSLMELFRIETSNNVISFSPQRIKTSGFTIPDPHPGYENYQRLEITGNITNSTKFGIINFIIGAGLRDNLGNKNEKAMRISLVK